MIFVESELHIMYFICFYVFYDFDLFYVLNVLYVFLIYFMVYISLCISCFWCILYCWCFNLWLFYFVQNLFGLILHWCGTGCPTSTHLSPQPHDTLYIRQGVFLLYLFVIMLLDWSLSYLLLCYMYLLYFGLYLKLWSCYIVILLWCYVVCLLCLLCLLCLCLGLQMEISFPAKSGAPIFLFLCKQLMSVHTVLLNQ